MANTLRYLRDYYLSSMGAGGCKKSSPTWLGVESVLGSDFYDGRLCGTGCIDWNGGGRRSVARTSQGARVLVF